MVARAGNVKDSITLEKVEQEPAVYVLPEVKERAEGAADWSKLAGNLDLTAPMAFLAGKYSVKDWMKLWCGLPKRWKWCERRSN